MVFCSTVLTHWGRATHICVGKLTIIGSDNGLSPGRRQTIIWTIAGILLIGPLGTNCSEILIWIQTFSFKKMHLKMSSVKWRLFVSASMCEFYMLPSSGESTHQKVLPRGMLELLTSWLQADPRLCLASLGHGNGGLMTTQQRSSLWTSPTKPNHQTPVPGLVRWSTQAPLLGLLRSSTAGSSPDMEHMLWSQLHLYLLQTLTTFPLVHGANQLELLTLADMNRVVHETGSLIKETQVSEKLREREEDRSTAMNTALERLVQVLQVSMATGGFRCSLSE